MLTVGEALRAATGATVAVRGHVVVTAGAAVICEMLAETYPPQPGGAQMMLEGLDTAALGDVESVGDTTWTSEQHVLTGTVVGNALRVR